jgi:hypothetical protein
MNFWRALMTDNQPPAFKLIAADRAKTFDGMLTVPVRKLIHDHSEIVAALGAFSRDVTCHWRAIYRSADAWSNRALNLMRSFSSVLLKIFCLTDFPEVIFLAT